MRRSLGVVLFLGGLTIGGARPAVAADWPQWMGPERDGVCWARSVVKRSSNVTTGTSTRALSLWTKRSVS